MKGKCAKQETIAIIENNGQYWIGSNWCNNAQDECPRKLMKTGEGYELCKTICNQDNHAEVDVCIKVGENASGGTLYLLGHTYCCDNCKKVMSEYGIEEVVIGSIPKSILNEIYKNNI
jgi:deoxycytidylate deaminase